MTTEQTQTGRPPVQMRVSKDRRVLTLRYADGDELSVDAELLRVSSPSAEVKGHGPGQRVTVYGKRDIEIIAIEPVGNYAVRITFDDMHNTGIYSWHLLRDLGVHRDERWREYLDELEAKGLPR